MELNRVSDTDSDTVLRIASEKSPVQVRGLKIGDGIPKICIPIVGKTREEILSQAEKIRTLPADLVEWRADWYEWGTDVWKAERMAEELRDVLGEIPLLFTFRTACEGGECQIEDEAYAKLNIALAEGKNVDMIDTELFRDIELLAEVIERAHACGVKVIASNHDFHKTPEKEEIVKRLQKMAKLHADIAKIAVMPRSERDVLTLLEASAEAKNGAVPCPVITMSMGKLGAVSRVCGAFSGSAVTFASAGKASAPGQIEASDMTKILEILQKSL